METDSIQLGIVLTQVMAELKAKNPVKKKKTYFYFIFVFLQNKYESREFFKISMRITLTRKICHKKSVHSRSWPKIYMYVLVTTTIE